MNYEKHIAEFAGLAQEYCSWVESEDKTTDDQLFYLQVLLSKLYCWGIQLPECEPTDLLESEDMPEQDPIAVLNYFNGLPVRYYSMVSTRMSSQVRNL